MRRLHDPTPHSGIGGAWREGISLARKGGDDKLGRYAHDPGGANFAGEQWPGFDRPEARREIRSLILELSRDRIVLYSSHNLFEAREIGRFVLVIRDGHLALFDRIENVKAARFVIGVRALEPSDALAGYQRQGDYYIRTLAGPEEVPAVIRELEGRGVKIREVREMENPLEDLFE